MTDVSCRLLFVGLWQNRVVFKGDSGDPEVVLAFYVTVDYALTMRELQASATVAISLADSVGEGRSFPSLSQAASVY